VTVAGIMHRLEAVGAGALLAALRAMGPVNASNLGGAVVRALGPLLPVSRIANTNLKLAMPELDRTARRRVLRGAWENLGRTVAELPHIGMLRQTASGPGWEMVGESTVLALAAQGGPAIFFSGHIGNWEMLGAACHAYGIAMAGFYRGAANPLIDAMMLDMRGAAIGVDVPMFPKGASGARRALAHLKGGGVLAMLMDQKMNDGIEAQFFGHPAMTAPALASLALRFRCPVIPGHVERIGPARFRMVCDEPILLPDSGDRRADVSAVTQTVNDRLESWIRARPESWLWMHRRWPKSLYR
jgi:KDO2-lipid IV(A) lauroyltransferase